MKHLLKTFQIKKKIAIHISKLEMLRKLVASLYLSVCSTKEVLYYTVVVIIKADHLSKKKKGSQSEMFSVFLYLSLKDYLANEKKTQPTSAFCFSSKFDTLMLLLSFLSSCLLVVTKATVWN